MKIRNLITDIRYRFLIDKHPYHDLYYVEIVSTGGDRRFSALLAKDDLAKMYETIGKSLNEN